ncbi:hypothetical protein [Neobacillus notoginsengisoli]|uniref:hypothetical protein n=1 Tax=Neobacillus notoginsengisoli TaxID=1578198 RepID=UPI0013144641|nr:hypothetical protein [Neobacillus notoginsengisoli]
MRNRKTLLSFFLLMAFTLVLAGCSGNKALLDDKGKEVSLENKDKPTLVFFFTGNT